MTKAHRFFNLIVCIIILISCNESKKEISVPLNGAWDLCAEIEKNIVPPTFGDLVINLSDFIKDTSNHSEALKLAITKCSTSGGGMVHVAKGIYHTGPIHLEDNVNLHLAKGAEIRFSTNPIDFLPLVHTSYEGTELMNYSPLVYAKGKKNIAITGEGTLNGQAGNEAWWPWCGKDTYGYIKGQPSQRDDNSRKRLVELAEKNAPISERIFGEGFHLRPTFIEFFECQNILIQGITITNAPFWVVHPLKSNNITIDGITVESHGPNNDGCDPEYCKDVLIKNCTFNTGDDCIAIKAGRNQDGRRVGIKSERIIVKNCKMIDGHGGVVIGSEISAGVKDVFVENCVMDSPNLDRAIRIKTNSKRGGVIENINVRNLEVGQVKEAVLKLNMFYATYNNQMGEFIPTIKNVTLENVNVKNGGYYAILAKGYEESPIENITLKNVRIEKVDEAFSMEHVKKIKLIDTYINGSLMQSPN